MYMIIFICVFYLDDYYDVDYNSDYELLEDYDFNQRKHSSHYWVLNAQMPLLTDLYLKNADLELVIHKNAPNLEFLIVRGNVDFEECLNTKKLLLNDANRT